MTEVPPHEEPESHLERAFHRLFVGRLRRSGAAVTEVPGPTGNAVRFTVPGTHRHWTLAPQVNVGDSRPDFLLETNDMNVPAVAVFVDGRAYHASAAANRLADDAAKRANLRDAGLVVLSVTSNDVAADDAAGPAAPYWYNPTMAGNLMNVPQFQAPPEAYKRLGRGPVDWLVDWVAAPAPDAVRGVARAVPMFLSAGAQPVAIPDAVGLAEVGRAVLLGEPLPSGPRRVFLHRTGALAVVVEMAAGNVVQVAAVLDDRSTALDDAHADAWRAWLRLSNALALRDWPTEVTTSSLVRASTPDVARPTDAGPGRIVGAWADVYDDATPGEERDLVAALAQYDGISPPVIGAEGPDGIPLDLSWPDLHVVVATSHLPPRDRADLVAAGWRLVEPSPEAVVAALAAAVHDSPGAQ